MLELEGKTAVVTGASRGIGRAIAQALAAKGANVALIYAGNEAAAEEALSLIRCQSAAGARAEAYRCDVSDYAASKIAVERIIGDFGGLDILVNNAGITRDALLLTMKEADFDAVVDTSLKGAFNIANRGEIAVRIIRACKEMGISTVAVFSEADRDALHVSLADESICIGPARAKDSYLNMSAILCAATVTGAEAIHPGYGLLAENARFAGLCRECGVAFIGPSAEVLARMGDKNEARRAMRDAGVPVIPGSSVVPTPEAAREAAREVGYPLLVKARAGGGGRGIRLVESEAELEHAYHAACAEAQSAFGDGAVYIEKYLNPVKHIEVQLLCDHHGNVVCLGERECSVQRRNQKLVEESPSPAVTPELRSRLTEVCARAAKAVGYANAGTIEFLLDRDGSFYFMEMNTRLQVEHPVTEMVTGVDLVKWQIRVAAGLPLSFSQEDIALQGCAIECRINAENPALGFCPSGGRVTLLHVPGGPWVRMDTALYQDYVVPPYYDSMIAKLIVHAKTREEALRKMQAALCELVIEGVAHNGELQMEILSDERFCSGSYTTDFMTKRG